MKTVELFGFSPSTFVRTARLVCEEKGIEYALVPLEFRADSHRDVHPFLKMPSLRHGDISLFETLAIVIYLNEEFPGPDLEASTAVGRARMFQWISASNDYLYDGIVGNLSKSETLDPKVVDDAKSLLQPVEQALAKDPYLAGDELTLADLFLLPMLLYAETVIGNPQLLSSLPNVAGWLGRLRNRPSVLGTEG